MDDSIEIKNFERSSAINKVFWGLLLLFINFKIGSFDIFNDTLGLLILIVGLNSLRKSYKIFSKALFLALFLFGIQIFNSVFKFSLYATRQEYLTSIFLFGLIINIIMICIILVGFSELADLQNLVELSNKIKKGLFIYIISVILVVFSFLFSKLAIIFLVVCVILYIYILIQIRSSYNQIDTIILKQMEESNKTKRLNIFVTILLFCVISISAAVGLTALHEITNVKTSVYVRNDLSDNLTLVSTTRAKMIDLGMDENFVKDMPDSEIENYNDINSVQKCDSQEFKCDGGVLQISQYVCGLGKGYYRFCVYYHWNQKPKFAHKEAIGMNLYSNEIFVFLNESKFSSLNLYDIGENTYSSEDITSYTPRRTVKSFILVQKQHADNYRGYMAFNMKRSRELAGGINNVFYYIHQSTIFNNSGKELIDINRDKQSFKVVDDTRFYKAYNIMAYVEIEYQKFN